MPTSLSPRGNECNRFRGPLPTTSSCLLSFELARDPQNRDARIPENTGEGYVFMTAFPASHPTTNDTFASECRCIVILEDRAVKKARKVSLRSFSKRRAKRSSFFFLLLVQSNRMNRIPYRIEWVVEVISFDSIESKIQNRKKSQKTQRTSQRRKKSAKKVKRSQASSEKNTLCVSCSKKSLHNDIPSFSRRYIRTIYFLLCSLEFREPTRYSVILFYSTAHSLIASKSRKKKEQCRPKKNQPQPK